MRNALNKFSTYLLTYEVGLSGRRQNADIADTLHLRDVAMTTPFCLSMGYNFGSMIGSDTLFDSRGGSLYMGCTLAPPKEYN